MGLFHGHKSLIRTLIWGLTLPTVILVVIAVTVLTHRLSGAVKGLRQATLSSQANEVTKYLSTDADNTVVLRLPETLKHLYKKPSDFFFVILDQSRTPIFASHTLTPLDKIDPSQSEADTRYFLIEDDSGNNPVYGATIRFHYGGQPYWIQVAQGGLHDDVLFDTVVEEFFESSGWVFIALLVIMLATNIVIISMSLRPLLVAQAQAAEIGPSTTDIRLPEENLPSEILPLVRAINSAFERLEKGFQTQREFTANAAHELRTPLAVLTTRIGKIADESVSGPLLKDVWAINRIVSQLLKVSQLEAVSIGHDERADLSKVAIEAAAYLGPIAIATDRSIVPIGTENPVIVSGSGELLGHAVRNLLENALRHTPPKTQVVIAVGADGSLSVSDEGPGIPEADREKVFQRFWRSNLSDGGAGLGLSIVEGIVQAHGGSVVVTSNATANGTPCGTKFIIKLKVVGQGS